LTDATVDVDGIDEVAGRCTGTAANPTAPAGVVCIYEIASSSNFESLGGFVQPAANRRAFVLDVDAIAAGDFYYAGIWAYTAP
jgi:hypothetical protein